MRSISTIIIVFGCALAYHAMAPAPVQSEKYKVTSGGKTHKVKCGDGYGALGPHDLRSERAGGKTKRWSEKWKNGDLLFGSGATLGAFWRGCGCQCAESVPTRRTRYVGTRGHSMAILEHPSGYYLWFGSTVAGVVRTTDPLVLELEGGSQIELFPICETSGEGKVCGIYNLSVEEMKTLASTPMADIKQFFRSTGAEGGSKINVERTEEGREYVEFRKVNGVALQLTAFCMAKDIEQSAK